MRRAEIYAVALGYVFSSVAFGCAPARSESGADQAPPAELARYVLEAVPSDVGQPLFVDFESKVQLAGYTLSSPGPIEPGGRTTLTLYWKSSQRLGPGWELFTHLSTPGGRHVASFDDAGPLRAPGPNGAPALPPSAWVPGKVYVDEQTLRLPRTLDDQPFAVGSVVVAAGVWNRERKDEGIRLRVISGPRDEEGRAVVARLNVKQLEKGEAPAAGKAKRRLRTGRRLKAPGNRVKP